MAGGSADFGAVMATGDDDFEVRPGRSRDAGKGAGRKVQSLAAQVRRAAAKAGYSRRGASRGKGTGRGGRRKRRAHSGVLPQLVLQQPGEILVIPSGWLHATVNLEALVSVALRFPREEDG